MYQCINCPVEQYQTRDDLEAHVASEHFSYLPYECESCRYAKFPTEYSIRYHYEQVHNTNTFCIKYQISPELIQKRQEIELFVRECAPNDTSKQIPTNTTFSIDSIFNDKPQQSVDDKSEINEMISRFLGKRSITETDQEPVPQKKKYKKKYDNGKSPNVTTCRECKRVISNQWTSMMYHTNFSHLQKPVFKCVPCNRIWTSVSKGDTLKHIRKCHNGDLNVIIDRKKEFIDEIRKKCDELFPDRPKRVIRIDTEDNENEEENNETLEQEAESDGS